ncbi:MAG: methylornithine synthase PylB [Peptococcaceae bacterium]|jgi:methylornithine synthase|nr:methylornithine synthase PylB [Peptococcaceae bacterium]
MIDEVLARVRKGNILKNSEIIYLLSRRDQASLEKIFAQARAVREKNFGGKIFSYGFVYFSTYCRNDCAFCLYRRSHTSLPRYRKSDREILEASRLLAASGVNLIDLTMGEDAGYLENSERLAALTAAVKSASGLPVMVSPGLPDDRMIDALRAAGADWLALYQETHRRELFAKRRLGQSFDARMQAKQRAAAAGLLIEEGIMAGFGETLRDHAESFVQMRALGAMQVRSMTFVPQKGTPMQGVKAADNIMELLDIAVMRLLFPDRLIPASLDVEGLSGLEKRLLAGANVITSLIPPDEGLAGVSQWEKDIKEGGRTRWSVTPVVEKCGLKMASSEEYRVWMESAKEKQAQALLAVI